MTPFTNLEGDIKRVADIIAETKKIKGVPLYVDFSIGGSTCHSLGECKNLNVFEDSDIAARYAQINNLTYVLGDKEKYRRRSEYDLLASFTEALSTKETYLVFQPKIDLSTGKTYGLEALTRWHHPTRGLIAPDIFIPLIEETKLIHTFTDWVLKNTLIECLNLMNLGYQVPISINISAKNLYAPNFFDCSMKIINEMKVPTNMIEFEITESALMTNPEESKLILQKFVDEGLKISLDDFGSGYSSLAYLTQFPIHFIKIDRFFMLTVMTNPAMLTIVESTIKFSKNLGYKVVVEGVETKEVVDLMTSHECDYAQGYYFAKPMKSNDLKDWFKSS
jgi:EAL domain-containing protein (putative c-di-GMP-specific phosphodiesterase class I)